MFISQYFPFLLFAFSALVSPGPNNLMIMYSGLNVGVRKSLYHVLGILFGAGSMLFVISLGFGVVFEWFPTLKFMIKVVGSIYMLYLAWKLARVKHMGDQAVASKPLSFIEAACFQLVNPKAWVIMMAFCSMAAFNSNVYFNSLILVSVITLLNIPSLMVWLGLGVFMEKILHCDKKRKRMNYGLSLLLALSVAMLWK